MFSAFELGIRYLRAKEERRAALLVAADNFGTPMVRRWRAGAGLILRAGAGGVVLSRARGVARLLSTCTVALPEAEELHRAGEPMFPPGATTGRTGDLGKGIDQFRPRVDALLRDLVDQALKEAYASLGEVRRVVLTNLG